MCWQHHKVVHRTENPVFLPVSAPMARSFATSACLKGPPCPKRCLPLRCSLFLLGSTLPSGPFVGPCFCYCRVSPPPLVSCLIRPSVSAIFKPRGDALDPPRQRGQPARARGMVRPYYLSNPAPTLVAMPEEKHTKGITTARVIYTDLVCEGDGLVPVYLIGRGRFLFFGGL